MKAIGSNAFGVRVHDNGRNKATRIAVPVFTPPPDLGVLFIEAYPTFAGSFRDVAEPGVAIVAIDEGTRRLAGFARLHGRPQQHAAAIVGRHDACDLSLSANDELPLRQLALILDPVVSWQPGLSTVNYRILDLRTEHGFVDERGRALRGLRCDGAAVLRCAGHALYVLPLGDPTDRPESGADAWACLPERVYFDETTHLAHGTAVQVRPRDVARTHVTAIRGPRETGERLVNDGDVAGTLEIVGPTRRELIAVGYAALRDGVLLGRYSRCDCAYIEDDSVSRVHALLIQVGDDVLVVDTASTNGTARLGEELARVCTIDGETELALGKEIRVRWRSLS